MADVKAIRERVNKATGGPWVECEEDRKGCQCGTVWSESADYPVATAKRGKWGDTYPAIRVPEGKTIGAKAEAYIEMLAYGEVSEEQAHANADFIAHARQDIPELLDAEAALREALEESHEIVIYMQNNTKHLEGCPSVPMTCMRCVVDDLRKKNRAALKVSVREGE